MKRALVLVLSVVVAGGALVAPGAASAATAVPRVPGPAGQTISGSFENSVVTGADGLVYGAGFNDRGQLGGTGDHDRLTVIPGLPAGAHVTAVVDGDEWTAVIADGRIYGTGLSYYHQFGDVGVNELHSFTPLPTLPGGATATHLAAAFTCLLVIGSDGIVYRIGDGTYLDGTCPLGAGASATEFSPFPGIPSGIKAVDIAQAGNGSNDQRLMVVYDDGSVWGMGDNASGQLTGSTDPVTTFSELYDQTNDAVAIAASLDSSVILDSDGTAYGVGDNSGYQLTGTDASYDTWHELAWAPGISDHHLVRIAEGGSKTIGLTSDGTVYAVGTGGITPASGYQSLGAVSVPEGFPPVADIAASTSSVLYRTTDGDVWGTGQDNYGMLSGDENNYFEMHLFERLPLVATKPVIVGDARTGATLTAAPGEWSHTLDSTSYRWLRNGVAIPGATASSYTPTPADAGTALSVSVTGSATPYTSATVTSDAVQVAHEYFPAGAPAISGTPRYGSTLSVSTGAWSEPPAALAYQWYQDGLPVPDATGSTFAIRKSDSGHSISATVTAQRAGYLDATQTAASVSIAKELFVVTKPAVTGKLKAKHRLKVSKGTWSAKPTSYSVRWYRNGKAIAHATGWRYTLTSKDAGTRITVKVTSHRRGYIGTATTTRAKKIKR